MGNAVDYLDSSTARFMQRRSTRLKWGAPSVSFLIDAGIQSWNDANCTSLTFTDRYGRAVLRGGTVFLVSSVAGAGGAGACGMVTGGVGSVFCGTIAASYGSDVGNEAADVMIDFIWKEESAR